MDATGVENRYKLSVKKLTANGNRGNLKIIAGYYQQHVLDAASVENRYKLSGKKHLYVTGIDNSCR